MWTGMMLVHPVYGSPLQNCDGDLLSDAWARGAAYCLKDDWVRAEGR
jgi:hypothetical protein